MHADYDKLVILKFDEFLWLLRSRNCIFKMRLPYLSRFSKTTWILILQRQTMRWEIKIKISLVSVVSAHSRVFCLILNHCSHLTDCWSSPGFCRHLVSENHTHQQYSVQLIFTGLPSFQYIAMRRFAWSKLVSTILRVLPRWTIFLGIIPKVKFSGFMGIDL